MFKSSLPMPQILDLVFAIEAKLLMLFRQQFKNYSGWLFYSLGIVLLWWWNWQLLLATVGGMGIMLLVYSLQTKYWQQYWLKWQRFLTGSQGRLAIAVSTGGLGAFSIYLATSIWVDTENRWLATGWILQSLGTLVTIALLVWQINSSRAIAKMSKFESLLRELTDSESLKRLMAIHQLTRLARHYRLSSEEEIQLKEYFCLMLSQSQDNRIREALLESIEKLGTNLNLLKIKQQSTLQIPIKLKSPTQSIYRSQEKIL